LSLATSPYLFLNLQSALRGLDSSLEESARSLGHKPREVFARVILPQLRPAYFSGALLVALHVLGDFGVVSLMRFETFSYALYLQYEAGYNRTHAAWLALLLLAITAVIVTADALFLRRLRLEPVSGATVRRASATRLGSWRWPALALLAAIPAAGVLVPLSTIVFWLGQ